MKTTLRALCCFFSALLLFSALALPSFAREEPEISGVRTALLYNVENDRVLYSLNSSEKVYPASSVKLMTAYLAYGALSERLEETVTVTREMLRGVAGYRAGLEEGDQLQIEALFYTMLMRGANDSAYILAYLVSGSTEAFVEKMNETAASLGMKDTHYANPGGMHEAQMVTTAADTLKIARAFAGVEKLLEISGTVKYNFRRAGQSTGLTIYNKNALISKVNTTAYYYEYAKGMNYGSTEESGITVTSCAQAGGLTYLCVVIGGHEDPATGADTACDAASKLLRYGVEGFAYKTLVDPGTPVCELPVTLSAKTDFVMLLPRETITVFLPSDVNEASDVTYSHRLTEASLEAPVVRGTPAGYLNVYYKGDQIGSVELVTGDDIERNEFLYLLSEIKRISRGRFFKAAVISAAVLTLVYVLAVAAIRRKRARRGTRYHF